MAEPGGAETFAERPSTPNGGSLSSMADKNSTLKCTFSAPGHSVTLLHGLASLRAQAQLLDVILTINNEVFQVHKVVLAACSDYFSHVCFSGSLEQQMRTSH